MAIKGSQAPCCERLALPEAAHEVKPRRVVLGPDKKFIKYIKMCSLCYFRIFRNHALSFEQKIIHKGESLASWVISFLEPLILRISWGFFKKEITWSSVTHEGCRWYYLFWCLESQCQTCLCQEIDTTLVLARSMLGERTSLNRYLKCGQALKSDS